MVCFYPASLCSLPWPGTHHPFATASQVLGLQVPPNRHTHTHPWLNLFLSNEKNLSFQNLYIDLIFSTLCWIHNVRNNNSLKRQLKSQILWNTSIFPAPESWRQKDQGFKANLRYLRISLKRKKKKK